MSEQEIDHLLERFDQTEPTLQRRIVAKLACDRQLLLAACEAVVSALDIYTESSSPLVAEKLVRDAVAKAREVRQCPT